MVAASYNKLPNPLSQIIQQLPVVDGLEVDKLLPFFKTLFQLSDFPGMSDRTLLELVYPYCRGSMAERVAHTLRCGGSVAAFHWEVLDAFVPGRLLEQLRHKHFYRVQSRGESLAGFVHSVRCSADTWVGVVGGRDRADNFGRSNSPGEAEISVCRTCLLYTSRCV